jgi:hypothetical protein
MITVRLRPLPFPVLFYSPLTSTGPSLEWISKLKNYWQEKYSWNEAQERISEWHHYTTEIEGMKVHFIHEKARTRQKEAIPLLLVHGWPGTFYECVITPPTLT